MNPALLSLNQAPDISTPLKYFVTAPVFLILACLQLLYYGPDILVNSWEPAVLSIVHSFTLGFISMCILGALFQLIPVITGDYLRHSGLTSHLVYIFFNLGTLLLILGFLSELTIFHKLALYTLIPALVLFTVYILLHIVRSQARSATASGIIFSIISLCIAIVFAAIFLTAYIWPDMPLLRQYTHLHILWALIGWVGFSVIAVSYQTIPMFHISREYPNTLKSLLIRIVFICLTLYSINQIFEFNLQTLNRLLLLTIFICLSLFSLTSIKLLISRKKKMPDTSLPYLYLSNSALFVCSILIVLSLFDIADLYTPAIMVFLFGLTLPVIIGMLTKIIPFLTWYHLHRQFNQSGARIRSIPVMNNIINLNHSRLLFTLYAISLFSLLLTLFNAYFFFYLMAFSLLAFSITLFFILIRAVHIYTAFLSETPKSTSAA